MDHGATRPLTRGTDGRVPGDIPHCYPCSILAWNQGAMDGFDQGPTGDWAYTQLHRDQLPNYWHWAQRNVLFDDFFASAWGPSFPNHLYSIAAQSGGARDNPRRTGFFSNTFGCDAPTQQVVEVYDAEGNVVKVPPCFDFETEGDLLTTPRHPVGVLRGDRTAARLHLVGLCGDRSLPQPSCAVGEVHPTDRHACWTTSPRTTLPPVTWITPRFELSEHPEFSFCHGENWTTQVIDAIMRSPDVAGHGDLPDVGRLRRFLRPRAAARRGPHGLRVPGAR